MAAAIKLGKNACIKKGATTVGLMTAFNLNIQSNFLDGTAFLDTYEVPVPVTQMWTASINGYLDPVGDSSGQGTLESLAISGGSFTDLYFYIDTTHYYKCDTVTDATAAAYIESFSPQADKSGIVTFSMNVKGKGPITRV